MLRYAFLLACGFGVNADAVALESTQSHASPPPMRPLPKAATGSLPDTPVRFVDPLKGDDTQNGSREKPWKTLKHATRQLNPGDTLVLRGGTYYEKVSLTRSGTAEAPITITAHPEELVTIDGGLREFFEEPEKCWEPSPGGAEGEYISTRSYLHLDDRRVPTQFLPAAWEPMWGIEEERPLVLGSFGGSMVPLHGYRVVEDLRTANELWVGDKKEMRDNAIYCGPGLWFNRDTGRIHIRLAHHKLDGLGDRAYRGETDPRKLPLVIAAGFGEDVWRMSGIKHVRVKNLVFRGATGSPMIHVYGSEDVELDHLTVYGGFPSLLLDASKNIKVQHTAFRGLAAPWTSRAHMKYRGTASYQLILRDGQPGNENIEFAWCEFTDDHDCAFLRFSRNLQFHHNFVDNFNDDGLECGPKVRDHTLFIYQNRIGACLGTFQQHEMNKDESPLDHDAKAGVFIFRNVIDSRAGVYYRTPSEPDPSGAFLHHEGALVGDHGGPIWPVMHVYHNTILRTGPVFRDYFLFGLGSQGLNDTERDVFNNILVQQDKIPGTGFAGIKEAGQLREGGNILWGVKDGPTLAGDVFKKFRASPMFVSSQKWFSPGWTSHDRVVDPGLTHITPEATGPVDATLRSGGAAVDSGHAVPSEWPDPLRVSDQGEPDVGALPLGAASWGVGVDGRVPLFGEAK